MVFHFPWHTGEPESVIRLGNFKLRKNLDTLDVELYDIASDPSEKNDLSQEMPDVVQRLDRLRADYLESVDAETVTLTRRNYVELLKGGWIENGKKRLAKLKAELAADPDGTGYDAGNREPLSGRGAGQVSD